MIYNIDSIYQVVLFITDNKTVIAGLKFSLSQKQGVSLSYVCIVYI